MTDQIRKEFEQWAAPVFDLTRLRVNIIKYQSSHTNAAWQAWQAAHDRYVGSIIPWPLELEPADIEHIAYQAGMEAKPMDGAEPYSAMLTVGFAEDDDGNKSYGLNVYCAECPEEGVIPLNRFEPPITQQVKL